MVELVQSFGGMVDGSLIDNQSILRKLGESGQYTFAAQSAVVVKDVEEVQLEEADDPSNAAYDDDTEEEDFSQINDNNDLDESNASKKAILQSIISVDKQNHHR